MNALKISIFLALYLHQAAFAMNKCTDASGAITFTNIACPSDQTWVRSAETEKPEINSINSDPADISNIFTHPTNNDALFKEQYNVINKMVNIEDIINAHANLIESTEKWIQSKYISYETAAKSKRAISDLQESVRRNKTEDRRAEIQFNHGVYVGDTNETLSAQKSLDQALEQARQEALHAVEKDPEIQAARTRLEAIGLLVTGRIKSQ